MGAGTLRIRCWSSEASEVAQRHVVLLCSPDGEGLPLTQPQPSHGSCPGTPEMRRRQEEAMRRLASQVPPASPPQLLHSAAGRDKLYPPASGWRLKVVAKDPDEDQQSAFFSSSTLSFTFSSISIFSPCLFFCSSCHTTFSCSYALGAM